MGNERFIFWFWESPTTGWHACKVKKHFHCLKHLPNDSQTIHSTINLSKPLLCVRLICSDWSDWSHFHFIMPVMPDKAAFVMICVQRYWGTAIFTAPKEAPSGKELIFIFIQTNARTNKWAGNMLMFHVDLTMKRLGICFKNDSFQWFRVDSFFWETITLYTVHFQI